MSPSSKTFCRIAFACSLVLTSSVRAQEAGPEEGKGKPEPKTTNRVVRSTEPGRADNAIASIRDEGFNRSQVMQTLSYLTDVIGPRLTGSPNLKRANEWTREKLGSWGLTNAHLEPWGPFGRGWSLKRFSAQIIEPQAIPLTAFPKAWSPGLEQPVTGEVIHLDAKTDSDLDKYKGKLKGAIVLASPEREVKARFEPFASRMSESNLLRLANTGEIRARLNRPGTTNSAGTTNRTDIARGSNRRPSPSVGSSTNKPASTNAIVSGPGTNRNAGPSQGFPGRVLAFLIKEGAAVLVSSSGEGDAGTLFVSSASLPGSGSFRGASNAPRAWSTNAPTTLPQFTLGAEDYNRLVRMLRQGEKLKMAVDLQVQFHDADLMARNTVAEIPGTDLKDELVMLGAHMDSWHSGTGATDNGAGVAACMEAVRILQALKLQPRRTVRIALWTGEEQGLLGSKAYVKTHFGSYTNLTNAPSLRSPRDQSSEPRSAGSGRSRSSNKLISGPDYEKLSAYFNLDHGTGKIRGLYMENNEAVRPIFRKWLAPFADLGAETLTFAATGGTDHNSFDALGLPGFQFIQDPIDYWTRTHHSNADVFDRIQAEDLKQASVILAAFVYNAAMADQKLPRKPE